MKTGVIALGVGLLTEALLVFLLVVSGGFGPCGPGSTTGTVILWIHTPGLQLADVWDWSEQACLIFIPTMYVLLWSIIAYLLLCAAEDRKR